MDRATIDIYDRCGAQWAASRRPVRREAAREFARHVPDGALRIDLGCGAGRYTADLGHRVIGLDASMGMLALCRPSAPDAPLVQADLEALPFGRATLHGGWANMSYLHVPGARLALALADLHRALVVGAPLDLQVLHGEYEGSALPEDTVGDRFFAAWTEQGLVDVLVGAGFDVERVDVDDDVVRATARRARTLADVVGPAMRMLVVGLNPSLYAADAGVGFARPGNRFWPAALAAGVATRDRDAVHALTVDGVGMTDVVKRATRSAAELLPGEYREGLRRVERLVRRYGPGVVCFVGLAGWRAVFDRHATAGAQRQLLGDRPVYLMPSTSGANAHSSLAVLTGHLRAASALAATASP